MAQAKPLPMALQPPDLAMEKVVQVTHQSGLVPGQRVVRLMLEAGLTALTGAPHLVDAWRMLVPRGERVGIKVNTTGAPTALGSCPALLMEVISTLLASGVRRRDILVYDRFEDYLLASGLTRRLPFGVRWQAAVRTADLPQLDLRMGGRRCTGYDEHVWRELPFAHPCHDPGDDRRFRSHAACFLTRHIDKLISLPVLKDHSVAGVSLALKNLSHGLFNNVSRSHATPADNRMADFIPAMWSLPVLREKAVLHILDGLRGVYHGGPLQMSPSSASWDCRSLFVSFDPVALDSVGRDVINARRALAGLAAVEASGRCGANFEDSEWADLRQPQYIEWAARAGIGTAHPVACRTVEVP